MLARILLQQAKRKIQFATRASCLPETPILTKVVATQLLTVRDKVKGQEQNQIPSI